MPLQGKWLPVEEIAAAVDAVEGDLVAAQNQTCEGVSWIAHAGEVAPGVGRVAGVDADGVAVDGADGFVGGFVAEGAADVAENELIGGQRNGLAQCGWREALGQGGGDGGGGLG